MYRLDLLCFDPPYRFDLRSMRRFATAPNAITLLAGQAAAIVGFVIVNVSRRRRMCSGYVSTLDVHPENRRQGLARRLMDAAESAAVEAGMTYLRLHVSNVNNAAVRFYEAIGYKRVLRSDDFYGEGLHAWLYRKNLIPGA